jgi:hypothetical protein
MAKQKPSALLNWSKTRVWSMHQLDVNGLVVDLVRKDIKNLHLAVCPPHGRGRVAAPLRVDDEAVRSAVISNCDQRGRRDSAQRRGDRRDPTSG